MPVLVQSQLVSRLIAIDVTGVRPEVRIAGADGAADSELAQNARHGWPGAARLPVLDPATTESAGVSAVRDLDRHGQAGGRDGRMEWSGSSDLVDRYQELTVIRKGKAAHEDGARGDIFVGGLEIELREEVHTRLHHRA